MNKEYMVGDFLFQNENDANLAKQEIKKIDYLKARLDYNNPQSLLSIYKKVLTERIFRTPVGYEYLSELRQALLQSGQIPVEEIPPVVMQQTFELKMRDSYSPTKPKVKASRQRKMQWPVISLIFNGILAILVALMFWIALSADNPNILNYEQNLINKYAAWEQELTEREQIIKEKERQWE